MLVLTRLPGETIHLTGGIIITVITRGRGGGGIRIGIDAPAGVEILRGELRDEPVPACAVVLAGVHRRDYGGGVESFHRAADCPGCPQ